jgi:hypothetical protein
MTGLDPAIDGLISHAPKSWMAATSAAMTGRSEDVAADGADVAGTSRQEAHGGERQQQREWSGHHKLLQSQQRA